MFGIGANSRSRPSHCCASSAASRNVWCVFVAICAIHMLLLTINAWRLAPVSDEFGHYYAGVCLWTTGDLSIFNVNPPLVRAIGTIPAVVAGARVSAPTGSGSTNRPEFPLGRELFCSNPDQFRVHLFQGRLLCMLFSILGLCVVFVWGRQIGGDVAGIVCAGFWAFQPQIIAHGSLITNDIPVTATMALTAFLFCRWLATRSWRNAVLLGLSLGFATSCKFTAFIMWPLLPLTTIISLPTYVCSIRYQLQLATVFVISIVAVGAIYRFEGMGQRLDSFQFISQTLTGAPMLADTSGNRFQGTLIGSVRVPFPKQVVLGLDRQQYDFDRGMLSYAAGMRAEHGWWWFYVYSMLVKLPVGTQLAVGIAIASAFCCVVPLTMSGKVALVMAIAILQVTAWQCGIGQQHRYIFPLYPYLFMLIANTFRTNIRLAVTGIKMGLLCTILACALAAPHWLASFNYFAGGTWSGYWHLFNDASDWGQDSYRVVEEVTEYSQSRHVQIFSSVIGEDVLRAIGLPDSVVYSDYPSHNQSGYYFVISKTDLVLDSRYAGVLCNADIVKDIGGSHFVFLLD